MPSLNDATNADMSGYEPVQQPVTSLSGSAPSIQSDPGQSVYMRSPIPPVWQASPDSLRTYFNGGVVPQHRLIPPTPPPQIAQAVNNVTNIDNSTNVTQNSTFGFSSGSNANGFWEIDPLGVIRQWGITATPTAQGVQPAVNFPIPFPSTVQSIEMTPIQVSGQHTMVPSVVQGSPTGTSFTWTTGTGTDTDGLCPAYWVAVGNGGSGGGGGGTGPISSVGLAMPPEFAVSGSPITSGPGTLTAALVNQSANTVWAGPTLGSPGVPSFRTLVAADIPSGVGGINQLTGDVTAGPGTGSQVATITRKWSNIMLGG